MADEKKPETLYEDSETGCCKRFNPGPWQEKEIVFKDRLFLKDHVTSFFHIPLNFGKVMKRTMEKIEIANAFPKDFLLLSDEKSLWGADVYIEVTKEFEGAEFAKVSGTFLTKVFEGPFKNMKKWIEEMKRYVQIKGKVLKKLYFFYTTCPKCAKHYGKNYVVIFAEV